jgi:Protein of unknown function (DUF2934)
MEPALEQRIRERAYEIWNATGRENGRADEHWFCAERELLASATRSARAAKLAESPKVITSNKPKVRKAPARAEKSSRPVAGYAR